MIRFASSGLLMVALVSSAVAHDHIQVQEVAGGLNHPWGMAFLPNGSALITERNGNLRLLTDGGLSPEPVKGLPDFVATGQGGMLGIAIDPDFAQSQKVYVCLNVAGEGGWSSEVHVGKFNGTDLVDVTPFFVSLPKYESRHHFGCRITFDNQGHVFISLGDRGGYKEQAQNFNNHVGTVVRLNVDGSIPQDNPFLDSDAPEVFTYGHRNVQGMAMHPTTGQIWTNEHGPKGGDEVNILTKGDNYGWPVITYGVNYDDSIITDETEKEGMRQPLQYWDPSFAPSGMMFYTGDLFSEYKGDAFIGSLKFRYLKHLKIEDNKIVAENNLIEDLNKRIRDVVEGPDGAIYVLTDAPDGQVLRLSPAS